MTNRVYDFTLAAVAGSSQRFDVRGAFIKVLSAPSGRIAVRIDGGPELMLYEGQGWRMPDGVEFRDVLLRNPQALANAGEIFIGDSRFEDSRISGNVRIIDQSADKTLAGNQFLQSASQAALAGQGSVVYVGANGGGGRNVVIKRLSVQSAVAGSVLLVYATSVGTLGAPAQSLASKLLGGAASGSARLAAANVAAATPSVAELPGVTGVVRIYVPANQSTLLPMDTPIVLSGARVLGISAEALNRDVSAIFDIEELA